MDRPFLVATTALVCITGIRCATQSSTVDGAAQVDTAGTGDANAGGPDGPPPADLAPPDRTTAGDVTLAVPMMIIDTHTHFYDPTRAIPAGRDRPIPWPGPNDKPLYRTVLPADYVKLAEPLGITGTVVVEASSWLEDNDWILGLAAANPVIVGFVGDFEEVLGQPGFDAALAKYRQNSLFRGIRSDARAALQSPAVLANLKQLGDADLVFDTLSSAADATKLAQQVPGLRIIVDHMAAPDVKKTAPSWFTTVAALAKQPNTFMKVSGLVEGYGVMAPADVEVYRKVLDHVFDVFGADRVMYGTNWPVSELDAPLGTVHDIVMKYVGARGQEAVDKFFWKNAKAIYKWVQR